MTGRLKSIAAAAPLLANGYALVTNAGLSSVLGIVFWMLATQLYSSEEVGFAAALISSMATISYLSQMNLSSLLTRFIPMSGARMGRLVITAYCAAGVLAMLVATGFALLVGYFAEPLEVIRSNPGVLVFFVAATVVWTIFALQDAVLSGMRRSVLVPISNAGYAALKIGALAALALVALPAPGGIFLAWSLSLLPVVAVVSIVILRTARARRRTMEEGEFDPRAMARFLGWDFAGGIALSAAFGLAPLMVTASAGVSATASYHLAWSFAYSIYLIGRAMSVSLIAEGAANPARLRRLISDAMAHTLLLVLAAVVVMVPAAPLIMGLFGPDYAREGAPILQVLVLSCLPWGVTTIYCGALRVRGFTGRVALIQAATASIFAAASSLFLPQYGAVGVAYGWLVAHSVVCIGVCTIVVRTGGPGALADRTLAVVGAFARLYAGMATVFASSAPSDGHTGQQALTRMDHPVIDGLFPRPLGGSLSDVSTVLLAAEEQGIGDVKAVFKFASSGPGTAAVKRNADALEKMATDARLDPFRGILPRLLVSETVERGRCSIETAVPGTEGRQLVSDDRHAKAIAITAAQTISDMHRRTATRHVLDKAWARHWIDAPVETLKSSKGLLLGGARRAAAVDNLRDALATAYLAQAFDLGLGHGDLWPGNIFFACSDHGHGARHLSGLIDWERMRGDAILSLDICHLLLTLRMIRRGEELGPTVRGLLQGDGWTADEKDVAERAGLAGAFGFSSDTASLRAAVLLTWIHHVATVLEKTERNAANLLWLSTNVDLVLMSLSPGQWGARE